MKVTLICKLWQTRYTKWQKVNKRKTTLVLYGTANKIRKRDADLLLQTQMMSVNEPGMCERNLLKDFYTLLFLHLPRFHFANTATSKSVSIEGSLYLLLLFSVSQNFSTTTCNHGRLLHDWISISFSVRCLSQILRSKSNSKKCNSKNCGSRGKVFVLHILR